MISTAMDDVITTAIFAFEDYAAKKSLGPPEEVLKSIGVFDAIDGIACKWASDGHALKFSPYVAEETKQEIYKRLCRWRDTGLG